MHEVIDLDALGKIREEGFHRSHVMIFGEVLADRVGARLTGSPDFDRAVQWSVSELEGMGLSNARAERWGEFGMAWRQLGAGAALVDPAPAVIPLQATPWSPATSGEVAGAAVLVPTLRSAEDFARWRGKLAGKITLYGDPPPYDVDPRPPLQLLDEAGLQKLLLYPLKDSHQDEDNNRYFIDQQADEAVARFFSEEHALAVLRAGGDGGALHDDIAFAMGPLVYLPAHRQAIPSGVTSSEAYGRMARLLAQAVPISVRLRLDTWFGDEHAPGFNVFADLRGRDRKLKDQVVMIGAHLDSWAAATGATDDGSGVIIAMEAMRILRAAGLHPRRTIRIALWGGEEEGELGSSAYVATRFLGQPRDGPSLPVWLRPPPAARKTARRDGFDVYFNLDRGPARLLGINAEGDLGAAALFKTWTTPLNDLGFGTVTLRHTGQVDSESFQAAGLPAFDFIQSARDDLRTHHTDLDTYERLPEADLKQAATVLASVLFLAADREAPIPAGP